jgi:hypothetical protein
MPQRMPGYPAIFIWPCWRYEALAGFFLLVLMPFAQYGARMFNLRPFLCVRETTGVIS